ncbi:hypothetical protein [Elizabethkingia meningoseptica]|uniref:hypothetical protein n=1 Tax=Elizabethkingia meningoseptica TaxID=238 RepID=UPI0016263399|nr:hypothetical protein [Elizabethkingia meningoseptica]MBG0512889.1 hypothetical protein [Elizabethkingia meningoseptica]
MEQQEKKPELISIKGMMTYFNCSRQKIYTNYIPKLERYPTKDNRVMFLFSDVKKLKEAEGNKDYEEVDVHKLTNTN